MIVTRKKWKETHVNFDVMVVELVETRRIFKENYNDRHSTSYSMVELNWRTVFDDWTRMYIFASDSANVSTSINLRKRMLTRFSSRYTEHLEKIYSDIKEN